MSLQKLMLSGMAGLALLLMSNANAGYTRTDSAYTGSVIGANFRSTAGAAGTNVDDENIDFTLPFNFTFYGREYLAGSHGWISGNGLLGFDLGNRDDDDAYCCDATYSQYSPANTVIAGWFDMYGDVMIQTLGALNTREFVITWIGNEYDPDSAGAPNRFQAILHETSNDIEFQYAELNAINGHYASVGGIKGDDTTLGLNFVDFSRDVRLSEVGLLVHYDPDAANDVAEPGSVALLGLGLGAIALLRRKSKRGRAP